MEKNNSAYRADELLFMVDKVDPIVLCGVGDQNLKLLEKSFDVQLIARGNQLKLRGEKSVVQQVENVLSEMVFIANKNRQLSLGDIEILINIVKANSAGEPEESENIPGHTMVHSPDELNDTVLFTRDGYIKSRTKGQKKIVDAAAACDLVVVIGPAGSGKTYMAVALSVAALKDKVVKKIILARPAVEAGESLGFLPGDYKEKIDPYLRPLYDALEEMLPKEVIRKYIEQGIIEVIPLAYMRGRTLNNAFVILDEAQNATSSQMKMFLTRLGVNSKAIINGDVTQIDLPLKTRSGLLEICDILQGVEGIRFIHLEGQDIVRHRLVRDIIKAYDRYEEEKNLQQED